VLDSPMPIYEFFYTDGKSPSNPFATLRFSSDEGAVKEAVAIADKLGPARRWLMGEIVIARGDREIFRILLGPNIPLGPDIPLVPE
jgi:hypothetical protein